jgi:hypothetical protein
VLNELLDASLNDLVKDHGLVLVQVLEPLITANDGFTDLGYRESQPVALLKSVLDCGVDLVSVVGRLEDVFSYVLCHVVDLP